MSQVIDRKIVDMEFNNSRFEANVSQTMSTLDKLKQKLNFGGMEKTFNTLETSSKNVKMDGLRGAIESVSAKFSALEVIGVTALANITNSAINLGKNFIKSISIDQVSAGWQKYADKTASVQTIMAATRKEFAGVDNQMELVEEQLERINWFTDETSYRFVDMVNNIGKFTSSGIKLETAATAMQGIATWASISGANMEQASHAMYNLSQSLGVGAVTLMDWKSIENANMATAEFKETAIEMGLALGTLKKNSKGVVETLAGTEVSIANFREGLTDKWFTSDVLMKTLDTYGAFTNKLKEAVDETGISTTELLRYLDDYSEGTLDIASVAKEAGISTEDLTDILKELNSDTYDLGRRAFKAAQEAKTFQEAVDYVKEAVSTGWMNTFELIFGNYEKAKKLWSDVAENFYELFVTSGERRNEILRAALYRDEWDEFRDSIEETGHTFDEFSLHTSKAAQASGITADELYALKKRSDETGESIYDLITEYTKLSGRELIVKSIENSFSALLRIIEVIKDAWADIFPPTTAEKVYGLIERFEKFTASLYLSDERAELLKSTLKGLFAILDIGKYYITTIVKGFSELIHSLFNIDEALDTGNKFGEWALNLRDSIKEGDKFGKIIRTIVDGIKQFVEYIRESIKGNTEFGKVIHAIVDNIKLVISKFREFISLVKEKVSIPKFSIIGILESAFLFIRTVAEKIIGVIKRLWPILKNAITLVSSFLKNLGSRLKKVLNDNGIKNVFDLLKAGILTGILTKLFKSASSLKETTGGIKGLISSISSVFDTLSGCLKTLQTEIQSKAIKNIAISIGILAASLLVLSLIDVGSLSVALTAITTLFVELIGLLKITDKIGKGNGLSKLSKGLISFSVGILILSVAMKNLAGLSWEDIAKGTVALGALFLLITLLGKALSQKSFKKNSLKKISEGLIAISVAMLIFAVAMKKFGSLEWEQIAKGLVSIGALMAILTASIKIMGKGSLSSAASILIISVSLLALFAAFKMFSKLDWEHIAKGLSAIGGMMLILALGLNAMKGTFGASVALVAASIGLNLFAVALKAISKLEIKDIAKSLIAIGIVLAEIAIALNLMKGTLRASAALLVAAIALEVLFGVLDSFGKLSWANLLKGFVSLAAIFAIIGVSAAILSPVIASIVALGVGLIALGAGLAIIGAGLIAISTGLKLLIDVIADGAVDLVKALSYIIEELVVFIPRIAVELAKLVGAFVIELAKILAEDAPVLVDSLLIFIVEAVKSLAEKTPDIVVYLLDLVIGVIDALAEKTPEIIKALVRLLMSVFEGFMEAMNEIDPKILVEGLAAIGLISALLAVLAGLGLLATPAIVGVIAFGVVVSELVLVLSLLSKLFSDKKIIESVRNSKNILGAIGEAFGALIGGFAKGMSDSLPDIATNLSMFMENLKPFLDGLSTLNYDLLAKAAIIPGVILAITAAEVINAIGGWLTGGSSVLKFGEDMIILGASLKEYSDIVKDIDSKTVESSANAALTLTEFARNIPNEGGWIATIVGDNKLSDFAKMLPDFGRNLSEYADYVNEINPEAVTASANAALTLTEFARNIPNEGGWIATIVGDNKLSDFAIGLSDIGQSIKNYYEKIKWVSPNVVTASANAALTLAEFANNLPNQGGWISAIVGDNTIYDFAKMLPELGKALNEYALEVKDIDPNVVTASSNAALTLATLATELPDTGGLISSLIGDNSLSNFAKQLVPFGEAITEYSNSVSGIDTFKIMRSTDAVTKIVDIAKIIKESKLMESSFGFKSDFETFSDKIASLGKGLAKYSDAVSGGSLDIKSMDAATNAVKNIVDVAKFIPETGGFMSKNVDLKKFGNSLEDFGKGIVAYSSSVSGENKLDTDAINKSLDVAKQLVDLSNVLEPISGFFTKIFSGSSDLSSFGKTLPQFGKGLAEYCESISGIDIDEKKVDSSVKIAEHISGMYDHMVPIGGIVELFSGSMDLAKFGKKLPEFANGIAAYCDTISNINFDSEKVTESIDIAKGISSLYDSLTELGGVVGFFSGKKDLGKFGEMLPSFADGIMKYCDSISNSNVTINLDEIESSISVAESLVDLGKFINEFKDVDRLKKFGATLPDFGSKLSLYLEKISKFAESGSESLVSKSVSDANLLIDLMTRTEGLSKDCTKNFIDGLSNLGSKSTDEFKKAFEDGYESVKKSAEGLVGKAVEAINSAYSRFYDAGKSSVNGFIKGLKDQSGIQLVEKAGWSIGRAALRGTQNALNSHSPSKEYEEVGTFCPVGLYKGVVKNLKYSELAGKEIGEKALNKTKKILSNISTVLDENINADPIIRPVLDLDNIETGAGKINALLSTDKAYSIQAKSLDIFGSDGEVSGNGSVNNWNFTQNNYSPKSLSSAEIYRQTKNQFSALKRRTS